MRSSQNDHGGAEVVVVSGQASNGRSWAAAVGVYRLNDALSGGRLSTHEGAPVYCDSPHQPPSSSASSSAAGGPALAGYFLYRRALDGRWAVTNDPRFDMPRGGGCLLSTRADADAPSDAGPWLAVVAAAVNVQVVNDDGQSASAAFNYTFTAAAAPRSAIVVNRALSAATAAARIS
jgi:hypothetical protein